MSLLQPNNIYTHFENDTCLVIPIRSKHNSVFQYQHKPTDSQKPALKLELEILKQRKAQEIKDISSLCQLMPIHRDS